MRFKEQWWDDWPWCSSPVARDLWPVWKQVGIDAPLEAWPIVDQDCADLVWEVFGYRCAIDDICFTADARHTLREIVWLGFESEFTVNGETDADLECQTLIARYATLLLQRRLEIQRTLARRRPEMRLLREAYPDMPSHPLKLRFAILKRDGFRCRYCGRDSSETTLQVDHIVAKSKGGSDNPSNYITACKECNIGKTDVLLLFHDRRYKARHPSIGQIPFHVALPGKTS